MSPDDRRRTGRRQQPVRDEGHRSLEHLYPDIAAQWDHSRNKMTPAQVTPGSNRQIWWLCDRGHSWEAAPYTRTRGHGCAACKGMKATPENNLAVARPDLMTTWHHKRNRSELGLSPSEVLPQANNEVWWTCPRDPTHDYTASPAARFRGRGCPYCAGKKVNASNSVAGVHPILASEWSPDNDRNPEDVTVGSNYTAAWICRKDATHRWKAAVSSRPADGAGCPYCDGKLPSDRNRLDLQRPALAKQWHPTKNLPLTPAGVSIGSNKPVWWICPVDPRHVWQTQVRARAIDRDGCKHCAPSKRSRMDIALACELAAVFPQEVDPVKQERLDLGHNRPHTVDILMKSLKIAIEYDGSFFHNGKEEPDRRKTQRLLDADFRVVRIREEPLTLLDPQHDISVPRTRATEVKIIADALLQHLTDLGWVSAEATRAYLNSPSPWATERAADIVKNLPESERVIPLSAKAAHKRKAEESIAWDTLF
ncbi:zinc-ribbon domain-containing protein [Crystallibacter degradans]|uniref:zinc-ribbon domain-containing protein n=1 Tax=Crystallibacter degradans TaxID=2726743 RepID=UPI0014730245|nr:zinc-ribbon domain-containing protein [Arthrobacter sp. SF27]NMR30690.1 hypothetical protein [Arthrobacter sp. SF27]